MPPFMPSHKTQAAKQRAEVGKRYTADLARIHARYQRVHQEAVRLHGGEPDGEWPHEKRMAFHAHVADAKTAFMAEERALKAGHMSKVSKRPKKPLRMSVRLH